MNKPMRSIRLDLGQKTSRHGSVSSSCHGKRDLLIPQLCPPNYDDDDDKSSKNKINLSDIVING